MKNITLEMIEIYKTYKKDWLGFYFNNINELTYHHIIKEENGGKMTIDNGALLTRTSHDYLHLIEFFDVGIYNKLNNILKKINIQKSNPTNKQLKMIDLLFLKFECEYASQLIHGKYTINKKKNMAINLRKFKQNIDKYK